MPARSNSRHGGVVGRQHRDLVTPAFHRPQVRHTNGFHTILHPLIVSCTDFRDGPVVSITNLLSAR